MCLRFITNMCGGGIQFEGCWWSKLKFIPRNFSRNFLVWTSPTDTIFINNHPALIAIPKGEALDKVLRMWQYGSRTLNFNNIRVEFFSCFLPTICLIIVGTIKRKEKGKQRQRNFPIKNYCIIFTFEAFSLLKRFAIISTEILFCELWAAFFMQISWKTFTKVPSRRTNSRALIITIKFSFIISSPTRKANEAFKSE